MTPEGLIKNAICEWLSHQRNCMFWVNASTGIYDPVRKVFRKNNSKYQRKGVSDILGIWQGRPLAIEVKSKKGMPTEEQIKFLEEYTAFGGIAIVARSIDDVVRALFGT